MTQHRFGGPEVLGVEEVSVPVPGRGEVLVAVAVAGIERGTAHLVRGEPYLVRLAGFGLRRPTRTVPGMELAGRVVALGPDVVDLAVGDEVMGVGVGTFAEFAVAPVAKLARRPAGVSALHAGVAPISGVTALQAVRDLGRVQEGHDVLILGASGGVGSFAVQLAASLGARVTGVASAAKLEYVRELGATEALDYRVADPLAEPGRYDVIVDLGGRRPLRSVRRALRRDGVAVLAGGEGGGRITGGFGRHLRGVMWSPFVPQRITTFVAAERSDLVAEVAGLIGAGTITPVVDAVVGLEGVADALGRLGSGAVRGKVAVEVRVGAAGGAFGEP